jgi:hypothetical protein
MEEEEEEEEEEGQEVMVVREEEEMLREDAAFGNKGKDDDEESVEISILFLHTFNCPSIANLFTKCVGRKEGEGGVTWTYPCGRLQTEVITPRHLTIAPRA